MESRWWMYRFGCGLALLMAEAATSFNIRRQHVRVDRPETVRRVNRNNAGSDHQGAGGGNHRSQKENRDAVVVEPIRFGAIRRFFLRHGGQDPDELERARDVAITRYKEKTGRPPTISTKTWFSDALILKNEE